MTEIMKISVYILVGRKDACLHDVTKHIYAAELGQRHPLAAGVDVSAGMNGFIYAITPSLQVLKVEIQLIHRTVDIFKNGAGGAGGPSATGHQRIQLRKVTLRDRFAPIVETLHSAQSVAQTLGIISAKSGIKRNPNNNAETVEIPIGNTPGDSDVRYFDINDVDSYIRQQERRYRKQTFVDKCIYNF